MTAKEHLQSFLETIQKPGCTVSEAMKFLMLTQQEEAKYVGRITPIANINGVLTLLKQSKSFSIKEKYNKLPVIRDCIITIKTSSMKIELKCRLIKEIGVRKASEEGQWGINATSFKNITKY